MKQTKSEIVISIVAALIVCSVVVGFLVFSFICLGNALDEFVNEAGKTRAGQSVSYWFGEPNSTQKGE